jgi:hypothetical protein
MRLHFAQYWDLTDAMDKNVSFWENGYGTISRIPRDSDCVLKDLLRRFFVGPAIRSCVSIVKVLK